jgi:hypothetical protein
MVEPAGFALRSTRRLAGLEQRSPKDQGSDGEIDHQSRDVDQGRDEWCRSAGVRSDLAPVICLTESRETRLMPVGLFRSEDGWVQVDYGTGTNIPVVRSKYEANRYKPDFDKLPSEAEYRAAEKKKEDDPLRP